MKLFKKRRKPKNSLGQKLSEVFMLSARKFGSKHRMRAKVRLMNVRAARNPKKYMSIFLSVFVILLLVNIGSLLFFSPAESEDALDLNSIVRIDPMIEGMNMTQSMKSIQRREAAELAVQGVRLKHELDSIDNIDHKTAKDSLEILRKGRQLQILMNNHNAK